MTCAHKRKDNKQIFQRGVTIKKQRKLEGIKGMNKVDTSCHSKLLKDDLTQNGVEGVRYIHLKHHEIKTNIQSSSNNMDCSFTTNPNYHIELLQ